MGGLFGGGKQPQAQKTQPAGALNIQTSSYGAAKPLIYGKNRVAINLVHYFNFKPIAHVTKQKTGGKGGPKSTSNTTYTYKVGLLCGVAVELEGIGTIWKNKEKHTLASLGFTFLNGKAGQTAWVGLPAGEAVPYANLAGLAHPAFDLADSPSLPNINVEAKGLCPYNPGTIDDALPSDIIVDYLTDGRHGAGFAGKLADLDAGPASFRKYVLARGLFISPIENNQRQAGAFIKEIADICNSAIVWREGKMNLIPYGDATISGNGATYTPNLTPLYDLGPDDFLAERGRPPVQHKEKPPEQQFNHHRIEYNARSNDYNPLIVNLKDQADIDDNGLRTKAVTTYKAITLDSVARDVLQIQQQRDLHVKNTYSFRLGIRHSLLEPMDYVTLTEPGLGLDRQLVRLIDVVEQDDAIDCVAEEVNIGVASSPLFNTVAPGGYNQDYNASPGSVTDPLIMNAPGLLTETGYEQWIAVAGLNPNWGGCVVWASDDNIEYRRVGEVMGSARYGSVVAATFPAGAADYDTSSVLRVQLYTGQLLAGTQLDCDQFRTLLYVGGEWMSYRDATLVSGTTYDVDTFRRAAYGSTRAAHAIGQGVAVVDEAIFRMPYDKGNVGRTVYFKFQSFNVFGGGFQDLDACVAYSHTLGASEVTAPMEYVPIAGSGVNMVPDQVSFFESATLPTGLVGGNSTVSMAAGFAKVSPNSLRVTAGNVTNYTYYDYVGNAGKFNITPGKKYIVSAWVLCGVAFESGNVHMYMRGKPSDVAVASVGNPGEVLAPDIWHRVSALVDTTGLNDVSATAFVLFNNSVNGRDYYVDGLMVEEAIGLLDVPSTYTRGTAAGVAFSALVAAQNAQATADGQIDIYRQATAPAIGGAGAKLGDYWQDSDDGKWWYCNGSSWVEAPDSRLPQVVLDAAAANSAANTAQTTANQRIRLFVQEGQPSGGTYIVGDQWFVPSTKLTRYWNGSGWSLLAEQASSTSNLPIINPDFEAGTYGWTGWTGNPVDSTAAGWNLWGSGGVGGGKKVVVIGPITDYARIINDGNGKFKITESPCRVMLAGRFNRNGVAADGTVFMGLFFYKADGSWNGNADVQVLQSEVAGAPWTLVRKYVDVPADTAWIVYNFMIVGCVAGGAWGIDSAYLKILPKSSEIAAGVGKNLIPNSNFGGANGLQAPWTIGWNPGAQNILLRTQRDGWIFPSYKMPGRVELFELGTGTGTTTPLCDWGNLAKISVKPNTRYEIWAMMSAYRCRCDFQVYWYDASGNYLGEGAYGIADHNGGAEVPNRAPKFGGFVTPPAGASYCHVGFRKFNTSSGANSVVFIDGVFFGEAGANQTELSAYSEGPVHSADEIGTGSNFGVTAVEDLYDSTWSRRIGLKVKGSRHILGGARNSRANIVHGIAAVRTTGALTADSSGNVTVNAHSVEISGETVTYNAVTNAVTGLTVGATYIIFTLDPYLDGGTRTYYAQTSSLSAQQTGEGAVMMGNVTIPSSGSSGGGGGGGGVDPCVDINSFMPEGHRAGEVAHGDLVQCWDECSPPAVVQVSCESNYPVHDVECWRIVSESGASVVASHCTPMTLRDLSIKYLPEMLGEEVLVQRDGELTWERVVRCERAGLRTVAKIKVFDSMYFAGETEDATIATHNPTYKP